MSFANAFNHAYAWAALGCCPKHKPNVSEDESDSMEASHLDLEETVRMASCKRMESRG